MAATDKSEALRLTRAQREIWLAHHIDPANPKYNIGEYVEIRGCIDEQCFEAALRQVVTEAEVLNFRFVEHQGEPRQISDAAYNWSQSLAHSILPSDPCARQCPCLLFERSLRTITNFSFGQTFRPPNDWSA